MSRKVDVTFVSPYEDPITHEQWPAKDKIITLIPLGQSFNAVFINNDDTTDDDGVVHIWVTGVANNNGGEGLLISYEWAVNKSKSVAVNINVGGI
jgi:hypothetical protein